MQQKALKNSFWGMDYHHGLRIIIYSNIGGECEIPWLEAEGLVYVCIYPFPKHQISDSSKLKDFPDNIFKVDQNGRKSIQMGRKHCGKGEIACYKQFLLLPQCFQKTCIADT